MIDVMTSRGNGRVVYSTEVGRVCPECGRPVRDCQCATRVDDAVPARVVAKLRVEKKGRSGKTVTVAGGFIGIGQPEKEQLAKKMQKACGTGGTVKDGCIEIQGDKREAVAKILADAGFRPVMAGG